MPASQPLKRIFCVNPFHTIKFFVVCQGFLQLTQLMISGYMKSSISTIERRFGLSSQTSGLIASFNEVGNTLLIMFVSYFGSRVHRPRLIGCGAILVSLAGFVIALPHFITGVYEYDRSITDASKNATNLCLPHRQSASLPDHLCTEHKERESQVVLMLLFLGQGLLGIGAVPIQPFGISYIDDFASKSNSPLYIGILFAATTVGPGVAFVLGSSMLRIYVDFDKIPKAEIHITTKDPRWVGAWWLGFMFSASIVAVAAVPYFFFPRELPNEEEGSPKGSASELSEGDILDELNYKPEDLQDLTLKQFIKMFPVALLRNIKNPIFIMVILALINLSAMVAGIATFLAKFLERQFTLTASFANMIVGAVNVPGAILGIVLGGAIMKTFHLTLKQSTVMCIIGMGLCVLCDLPLLAMGCPTQTVSGLDYSGSSGVNQLTIECNRKCNCSSSVFNPVCGQDNIEYLSPCHAGCSAAHFDLGTHKVLNYTNCNCIEVNGAIGYALPGTCGAQCSHFLLPFVTLACISGFVASISHTPAFVLILRNVRPEDKSFAVGIQFLLLRICAWLPAPVLYGSAIDTTCLLWQTKCKRKAACQYYDNTLLRQRFLGLQLLFEVFCFLSFIVVYVLLWRKERQDPPEGTELNPQGARLAQNLGAISESGLDSTVLFRGDTGQD